MSKLFGCMAIVALLTAINIAIDLVAALIVTWAMNSFTQLHPTFQTVFVIMIVLSVLISGNTASKSRSK